MNSTRHSFTFAEKVRSIFALFILALFFILGGIFVLLFGILTAFRFTNFVVTTIGKAIGNLAFWLLDIEVELIKHGNWEDQPSVYIFNHSSTLDIPITLAVGLKNARYVAKYELLFNPVFGIIGLATGQVFINRGTSSKAIKSLKKAYERIKKNKLSLVIAPEGTRKHDEPIGKFKKGAFHTAKDLGYPIVPLFYENSHRLSPGSSLFFHKGKIVIHLFEPISSNDWTNENLDEKISMVKGLYEQWYQKYNS